MVRGLVSRLGRSKIFSSESTQFINMIISASLRLPKLQHEDKGLGESYTSPIPGFMRDSIIYISFR